MSEILAQPERPRNLEEMWAYSRASHLQIYEKFTGNGNYRTQQQNNFMAGEISNPILDTPGLTQQDLDEYIPELYTLYLGVDTYTDEPSLQRDAYSGIIEKKLAEVYYLHQARNVLDIGEDPDRESAGVLLMRQAEELFGLPEKNQFNVLVNNLRTKVAQYESLNPLATTIKNELLAFLPENSNDSSYETIDYSSLIDQYKPLVESEFAGLLVAVPEDKDDFTPEDMVKVFSNGIKYYESIGIVAKDQWKSEINSESKTISTSQEKKVVEVGAGRKSMNNLEMKQLLLHEVGVHVQRRLRGDNANFAALGSGLVGYEDTEEGLGVVMEQIYAGKTREAGVQYYTLLGLAIGLDGHKKDFSKTYEIAWRRQAMIEAFDTKNGLTVDIVNKAKKQAYIQCVRIFRGTPCNLPGVVFPKDIAYFDGNAKIWEYLRKINGDQEAFKQLFKGKFNPTDSDHMELVNSATWS